MSDGPIPFPRRAKIYTAAELQGMAFAPLQWVVPHYVPEGLSVIAGKPKIGKSWLMLATALAVATGGKVLGETCPQRGTLYYALEDSDRRLRARSECLLGTKSWPDNLFFIHELPNIDKGGVATIEQHLNVLPDVGLVILDTLAVFKGSRHKNEEPYAQDYRTISELHAIAHSRDVYFIVVHHLRKAASDDPFDRFSGTNGLTGAADHLVVLDATKELYSRRLTTRGRDADSEDKMVFFDIDAGTWEVTGDYEEEGSIAKAAILATLRDATASMTPAQIAEKTGLPHNTVKGTLRRLHKDGKVSRTSYGSYSV